MNRPCAEVRLTRPQPARDENRVAQRQHAIEFGQGEDGFRRRGIGDRAAVGGEDAAFEASGALRHLAPDPAVADDADRAAQRFAVRRAAAKLWRLGLRCMLSQELASKLCGAFIAHMSA